MPDPPVDSPLANRLIVILGEARSGTTWLHELLLAHRDVAGVEERESHLLGSLAHLWVNFGRTDPGGLSGYVDRDELAAACRRFCDALFLAAARSSRSGARYFVEKTPGDAWQLPWLKYVYPDAWYVHIVRDGRDVIRSAQKVRFLRSASDLVAAVRWRDAVRFATAQSSAVARFRQVRYEALVESPWAGASELFQWIGLADYIGLEEQVAGRVGRPVAQFHGEQSVGPGKWRGELSTWRVAQIHAGAGGLLCDLGYLSADELSAWKRRPEYWIARARLGALTVKGRLLRRGALPSTPAPLRRFRGARPWSGAPGMFDA